MKKVDLQLLASLSNQAKTSFRKRKNLNFHQSDEDTIHRMLNAFEPGTYVRPHKHDNPDKRELFILLKGKLAVIEFDETGKIADYVMLSSETGNIAVEIQPKIFHMVISFEQNSVAFEIKDGPYNSESDKKFAIWSPEENSENRFQYLEKIIGEIETKKTLNQ